METLRLILLVPLLMKSPWIYRPHGFTSPPRVQSHCFPCRWMVPVPEILQWRTRKPTHTHNMMDTGTNEAAGSVEQKSFPSGARAEQCSHVIASHRIATWQRRTKGQIVTVHSSFVAGEVVVLCSGLSRVRYVRVSRTVVAFTRGTKGPKRKEMLMGEDSSHQAMWTERTCLQAS